MGAHYSFLLLISIGSLAEEDLELALMATSGTGAQYWLVGEPTGRRGRGRAHPRRDTWQRESSGVQGCRYGVLGTATNSGKISLFGAANSFAGSLHSLCRLGHVMCLVPVQKIFALEFY